MSLRMLQVLSTAGKKACGIFILSLILNQGSNALAQIIVQPTSFSESTSQTNGGSSSNSTPQATPQTDEHTQNAQDILDPKPRRIGISGALHLGKKSEYKPEGKEEIVRHRFNLDGWVDVARNGCVKVRTRLSSGTSFNSEWDNAGVEDGEFDMNLNLRYLYVDLACANEAMRIEAGVMPSTGAGALGLTSTGWIEGLRVKVKNEDLGQTITMTAGEVDELKQPNLLERDRNGFNLYELEVVQRIFRNQSMFVSVANMNDETFTRAGVTWALNKYWKWLTDVSAEVLHSSEHGRIGHLVDLNFAVGKWKFRLYHTSLIEDPDDSERKSLLAKSYYGYGKNYYLYGEIPLSREIRAYFRVRAGDAKSMMESGVSYRF